jgi:hypothetical protein
MTEPDDTPTGLAATATETPERSVQHEREVLGDQPDTGAVVPEDDAQ